MTSFDGNLLSLAGDCEYLLVTQMNSESISDYRIVIKTVKDFPSSNVSYTRLVRLEVNGTSYEIISGGIFYVNGVQRRVPFKTNTTTVYAAYTEMIVSY